MVEKDGWTHNLLEAERGRVRGVDRDPSGQPVVGVRVVKGFGSEPLQAAKLSAAADGVYEPSMRALLIRSRFLPAIETVPNLGLIMVLAYGGNLVLDGRMTIGQLVSFNIYVILLVQPLRTLGMGVTTGQRSAAVPPVRSGRCRHTAWSRSASGTARRRCRAPPAR